MKTNIIIICAISAISGYSQEIQFSQYNSFPLYLNPALTGETEQQRFSLNSRSQWVNIQGAYKTMGFSYDYNLKKIKSGLGLLMLQDESSAGGFSTLTAGGLYSYHLKVNKNLFINSGVRVAYMQQKLDPGRLTFTDQLIRNDGSPTVEVFDNLVHDFVDFSWGCFFYRTDSIQSKNYWLGLALDHINKPQLSFNPHDGYLPYGGVLPVKFTLHGRSEYRLNKNAIGFPENIIAFSFLYRSQLKWDQGELGVSYIRRLPHKRRTMGEWKKTQAKVEPSYHQLKGYSSSSETPLPFVYLEAGLSYRGLPILKRYKPGFSNHDALIFLFGFNFYDIKVAYTFDFTVSMLGFSNTAGAHEISIIYEYSISPAMKKIKSPALL